MPFDRHRHDPSPLDDLEHAVQYRGFATLRKIDPDHRHGGVAGRARSHADGACRIPRPLRAGSAGPADQIEDHRRFICVGTAQVPLHRPYNVGPGRRLAPAIRGEIEPTAGPDQLLVTAGAQSLNKSFQGFPRTYSGGNPNGDADNHTDHGDGIRHMEKESADCVGQRQN